MELLSPAGSKESFIAAINAGADSVYLGAQKFNARINADNFNYYDLEVLIDYAKKMGVKVYIAFNTLVRHEEINEAVRAITTISRLNPDALIIQDLGIARIVSEYFPNITIHASTQMAAHNSAGVRILKQIGFKRAILARELTLAEIKLISNKSRIELEVFAHGALCFSLSGLCLFSSVMGGYSGNRGRCAQPCRCVWRSAEKSGYLFSPRDLELADYVGELKKIGIHSLKIEGRMRSSEYVYNATKAYRMLIDAKEGEEAGIAAEAKKILNNDYARKKSICLLSGRDNRLFEPDKAQCVGKEIGEIKEINDNNMKIYSQEIIQSGDRLAIANPANDQRKVFKLDKYNKINKDEYCINVSIDKGYKTGNPVFKVGSSEWHVKILTKQLDKIYGLYKTEHNNLHKENIKYSNEYTSLISGLRQNEGNNKPNAERLWFRVNNNNWLSMLNEKNADHNIIVNINKTNLNAVKTFLKNNEFHSKNIYVELPPFIAQRELCDYADFIKEMDAKGVNGWVLNNISHFELISNDLKMIAGPYLYTLNAYSAKILYEFGADSFITSWEDDYINIRRLVNSGLSNKMIVNVFGYPVLARSRMLPKDTNYGIVSSQKKDLKFNQLAEGNISILIPENPFMIFNSIPKLKETGIGNFLIDLSYIEPQKSFLLSLKTSFSERINFNNSIRFNFKFGLK
ncbi:MAG: peptidase U32 family protein [Elusimicrobiota bacterium]